MSQISGSASSAPDGRSGQAANDDCKESLSQTIEIGLIHRLLSAQLSPGTLVPDLMEGLSDEPLPETAEFTECCLKGDAHGVNRIVDHVLAQGYQQDKIFLELITPAARHLGVLWEKDLCSFSDVTCGLALMHQITHRLGYRQVDGPIEGGQSQSVLLTCAPGSQHFLGLTIVADFFRREGASVILEISSTEAELMRVVANEWFDVLGLSIALESQLAELPALIENLRKKAGNPQMKVMLGGPVFTRLTFSADLLGADAISTDPVEAIAWLKTFAAKDGPTPTP